MASPALPSNRRLVNIGTHSLALYTHGPEPKSPHEPVVLFISGVASDALNWQAVVRLIGSSLRSYTYDRSGYHHSDTSPLPPTAENIAIELSLLIKKAPISNPLILVAHSWAGVLTHEYFALKGTHQVAGLVLVDANHETSPLIINVNDPVLWDVVGKDLDIWVACGVEQGHKMTKEEWDAFRAVEATEKHKVVESAEEQNYSPSFEALRRKGLVEKQPLLKGKPVHVIVGTRSRDWLGLLEAGIQRGNGTDEQREHVRRKAGEIDQGNERIGREFLKLSEKNRIVFARESGHNVQLTQPELIVHGVNWVLDNLSSSL